MTDVLLGQAYFLRFDPKLWNAMQPYPPLGTLYAAALLRRAGFEVALFDAVLAGSEQEWTTAIERRRPRHAVLFEDNFNYLSKMCLGRMRDAGLAMVRAARAAGVRVAVCGSDATDHPELYLDAGADAVIAGEGEATLVELIASWSGRAARPPEEIAGLIVRAPDGGFLRTAPRPNLRDLDGLPLPAWDLVDVARYRALWRERHGRYSVNMVTTRGCPYHCNWCAKPIWGQRYNARGPDSVAEELRWHAREHGAEHVWFADDIFGLKPGWIARFADAIEAGGVRLPFKSLSRADLLLRAGEVEALARAGCETVWIGAESGSQKILDAMEKGTRVEQIESAAARLRAAGIRVGFFVQFGYPGEGRADVEATLALLRRARPDDLGVSVSYPLPGTRFYERVRAELGAKQNWRDSEDLAMLYRGPFSTAFYRQLHELVHREQRLRTAVDEVGRALGAPATLRPRHARATARAALAWVGLPLARRRLARLERDPHVGLPPLPPGMSFEEASRSTPQEDA